MSALFALFCEQVGEGALLCAAACRGTLPHLQNRTRHLAAATKKVLFLDEKGLAQPHASGMYGPAVLRCTCP